MNILFTWPIPFNPLKGGVERVTDVLAREFVRRGHRIFFLHTKCFEEIPKYDYDVNVDFCPEGRINSENNHSFYREYLRNNKIDVVINQAGAFEDSKLFVDVDETQQVCFNVIHCNPQFYYEYFFKQISNLRNHSFIERIKRLGRIILYPKLKRDFFNRLKAHYQYLLSSQSKNVVLLSSGYIKNLKDIVPNYPEILINAIGNPTSFSPVESSVNKGKVLLFVGRMENQNKHPDRVIKIWQRICNKFPDWRLIMVGDGPSRKALEMASQDLPRIEFKGFIPPYDMYKCADILLLTSDYEGFPMVILEGLSLGCVPIAFKSFSSISDVIKDGRQLVTPFSMQEYVGKLSHLMSDKDLLSRLRAVGYSIAEKFSVKEIADRWETLFYTELKRIGK